MGSREDRSGLWLAGGLMVALLILALALRFGTTHHEVTICSVASTEGTADVRVTTAEAKEFLVPSGVAKQMKVGSVWDLETRVDVTEVVRWHSLPDKQPAACNK